MAYDAVAFLEGLFRHPAGPAPDEPPAGPDPLTAPGPAIGPGDLPGDWWVLWDERAAIMEYDGGLPRDRAEARALADVLRQMEAAGVPLRNDTCI